MAPGCALTSGVSSLPSTDWTGGCCHGDTRTQWGARGELLLNGNNKRPFCARGHRRHPIIIIIIIIIIIVNNTKRKRGAGPGHFWRRRGWCHAVTEPPPPPPPPAPPPRHFSLLPGGFVSWGGTGRWEGDGRGGLQPHCYPSPGSPLTPGEEEEEEEKQEKQEEEEGGSQHPCALTNRCTVSSPGRGASWRAAAAASSALCVFPLRVRTSGGFPRKRLDTCGHVAGLEGAKQGRFPARLSVKMRGSGSTFPPSADVTPSPLALLFNNHRVVDPNEPARPGCGKERVSSPP